MKRIILMGTLLLTGCPTAPDLAPVSPGPSVRPSPAPQYLDDQVTAAGRPYVLENGLYLQDKLLTSWERDAQLKLVGPKLRYVVLATGGQLVAKLVDGGARKVLLPHYERDLDLQLAPDGHTLAVRTYVDARPQEQYGSLDPESIYLVDVDDPKPRRWPNGFYFHQIKWAPKGLQLAIFGTAGPTDPVAFRVATPDNDQSRVVAAPNGSLEFFDWLPDAEHLVTTWFNDKYAGTVEIRTYAIADGKETKQVIDVSGGHGPGFAHAEVRKLTPDGKGLVAEIWRTDGTGGQIVIDLVTGTWAPL